MSRDMSTPRTGTSRAEMRRTHYVDRTVQGRLIAGLVVLEIFLFSAALSVVYLLMVNAVEAGLYRVHQSARLHSGHRTG